MTYMTVKKLIAELKKLPQDLPVGVAMGDNAEGEVAGWVCSIHETEEMAFDDKTSFNTWTPATIHTGRQVVILRC